MPKPYLAVVICSFLAGLAASALAQTPGNRVQVPAPRRSPAADAQGPTDGPPPILDGAAAQRKLDELLRLWEEQSKQIETLDARFVEEDVNTQWASKTRFRGRAILKKPNLVFLDFQKQDKDKKQLVAYKQIRCTGKEVLLYNNETAQIFVYPLPADEQQRALEEGPLPFLFDMHAAKARERYHITLVSENLTHYWIRIQPRLEIDREEFIRADVMLNKEHFMPEAIRLYAPNGKDTKTFWFTGEGLGVVTNRPVNDQNFEFRRLKGWKVVVNPAPDDRAPSNVGVQNPPARRSGLLRPGPTGPARR